jgi:hypothetical protein
MYAALGGHLLFGIPEVLLNAFPIAPLFSSHGLPKTGEQGTRKVERPKITTAIHSKATEMGIKKPIKVLFKNEPEAAENVGFIIKSNRSQAYGNRLLPGRAAFVIYASSFPKESEGREFFICQELARIKNNDFVAKPVVGLLASVISVIGLGILFPSLLISSGVISVFFSPVGLIAGVIGVVAQGIFSNWMNRRTFQTAIKSCSETGLEKALNQYKQMRDKNLTQRQAEGVHPFFKRMLQIQISKEGNNRFDWTDYSLTKKITLLERALKPAETE